MGRGWGHKQADVRSLLFLGPGLNSLVSPRPLLPLFTILYPSPNPDRTVPFVAKAVGHPIAKYASLAMAGRTLKEIGLTEEPLPTSHVAVKEVVLPFNKFPGLKGLMDMVK